MCTQHCTNLENEAAVLIIQSRNGLLVKIMATKLASHPSLDSRRCLWQMFILVHTPFLPCYLFSSLVCLGRGCSIVEFSIDHYCWGDFFFFFFSDWFFSFDGFYVINLMKLWAFLQCSIENLMVQQSTKREPFPFFIITKAKPLTFLNGDKA